MATLEDKLMGEKLEYYCSSDEGEPDECEDGEGSSKGACKQGPSGFVDPNVCPPPPTGGYQGSTNTGPKGVVEDWQRFKKLQAEKREESERERIELAKKLTMTTATTQEEEERKKQEELDAELAELMSDEFLERFQRETISEMLRLRGHYQKFGKVLNLTSHEDFLECVDKEKEHITIIIHIYDRNVTACATLNECLNTLAADFPTIKFAKISSSVAGMSRDFRTKGLPAILVYKGQQVIGNFVRVTDELSDDFFISDVESFLIEKGILVDKSLYY